jgi:hypothetical protein
VSSYLLSGGCGPGTVICTENKGENEQVGECELVSATQKGRLQITEMVIPRGGH